MNKPEISIILPARNEAASLRNLLPELRRLYPDAEILVVDDGSSDDTGAVCRQNGVTAVHHPYSKGNGAAVKSGARAARGGILVFMDADGQHSPADISKLLDRMNEGYDMVVGSRSNSEQAGFGRLIANNLYNRFASLITGHKIGDLTSGFRAVNADKFHEFLHLLPNGFSYPSTITMAFFRAGYSVSYAPISVEARIGKSHIRPLKDGTRFLIIIFKIGTLYSPLKIFVPTSLLLFMTGVIYYGYTFLTQGRFTNMSALLFIVSIMIFLIGLVSEQITTLVYNRETGASNTGDSSKKI